jgi:hypothetical protein
MALITVAPAYVVLGDFTQANNAGIKWAGKVGEVTINPNIDIASGNTDNDGVASLVEAQWVNGVKPEIRVQIMNEDKAFLSTIIPGAALSTANGATALLFGAATKKVARTQAPTLAIFTQRALSEYPTAGVDAEDDLLTWWFPGVILKDLGQIKHARPSGDNVLRDFAREMVFEATYCEKDQATTPVAIPEGGRVMFQGPPKALGLTAWQCNLATLLAATW